MGTETCDHKGWRRKVANISLVGMPLPSAVTYNADVQVRLSENDLFSRLQTISEATIIRFVRSRIKQ